VVYVVPVAKPSFVVPLADLERGPRELEWQLTKTWLAHALEGTEAEPVGEGRLELSLAKNGKDVLVRGKAAVRVVVPDSRTLDPVELTLGPEIFLLLAPAAPPAPAARRPRGPRTEPGAKRAPAAAKKAVKRGWEDDPELTDRDAALDTYSGEQVVLDDFVREFILLEIPMVVHKDLPSEPAAGIGPPPAASPSEPAERVDPRLAPLAAIAERMRGRKD
jgi:uncharacterized metal-binding protein YceD (DUF177 family)